MPDSDRIYIQCFYLVLLQFDSHDQSPALYQVVKQYFIMVFGLSNEEKAAKQAKEAAKKAARKVAKGSRRAAKDALEACNCQNCEYCWTCNCVACEASGSQHCGGCLRPSDCLWCQMENEQESDEGPPVFDYGPAEGDEVGEPAVPAHVSLLSYTSFLNE
jgi:hypothetical protein